MRTVLVLSLLIFTAPVLADFNGLRIVSADLIDNGTLTPDGLGVVDVVQDDDCDNDQTTVDPEPFHDTVVQIKLRNTLLSEFTAQRFYYVINNGGSRFKSRKFGFLGSNRIAKKQTGTLNALMLRASNGRKYFSSLSTPIDASLGFANYRLYIEGRDGRGRRHTLSTRLATGFSEYDRCS